MNGGSAAMRVLGYIVAAAIVFTGVFLLFPEITDLFRPAGNGGPLNFGQRVSEADRSLVDQAIGGAIALLTSLIFAAPLAFTYMITKRQEGYEKTFVQVLVMLPLVVAAVTRVVRGDLALAFALAGIVAAVRFRTTLRDLKNAVFAFTAIGIGLASGTGAWVLAALLSLFFSLVAYTLWRRDVGGADFALTAVPVPLKLSEALVPGESQESVVVGNRSLVGPLDVSRLSDIRPHAERLAHFVRADALKSKRKYDTLLILYAAERQAAYDAGDAVLQDYCSRYHLLDEFDGPEETTVVLYLLRLVKSAEVGELLEKLHCDDGCPLRAAEMKRIKGMRKLVR